MAIDTGSIIGGSQMCMDSSTIRINGNVVFDSQSTSNISPVITVPPGSAIVLVGYNLDVAGVGKLNCSVQRVLLGNPDHPHGVSCCDGVDTRTPVYMNRVANVVFQTPINLGGKPWEINPDYPMTIINLPGTYVVEIDREKFQNAVGQFYVEYLVVPDTTIPSEYLAGVK